MAISATDGSALDDDDDEEEEEEQKSPEDDFLVPFFVGLPFSTAAATSPTLSRRSSSSASNSGRPTFSPLTPLSNSAIPEVDRKEKSSKGKAQPIGFLRPEIVKALVEDQRKMVTMVRLFSLTSWSPRLPTLPLRRTAPLPGPSSLPSLSLLQRVAHPALIPAEEAPPTLLPLLARPASPLPPDAEARPLLTPAKGAIWRRHSREL